MATAAALSALDSTAVPYWAAADGELRLVRQGFSLKTPPVGRLAASTRILVMETKRMQDGALRGAVALEGKCGEVHGWMTLVLKDGTDNVRLLSPQPALGLAPHPPQPSEAAPPGGFGMAAVERAKEPAEPTAEPVAEKEAAGGAAFVF